MTKEEYASWVDKIMEVRHIDTARTTNLPIMDLAGAMEFWADDLGHGTRDPWQEAPETVAAPAPLRKGDRLAVYWSDMREWFDATFLSSVVEPADGGGTQRTSKVLYDAVGLWSGCSTKDLTYHHCLDDEMWKTIDPDGDDED